jgi:hypothetical protein
MKKRKHVTKWYYTDPGGSGTFIRAGFVRNSAEGDNGEYPHDCIRLQIRSAWEGQGDIDFCVRLDEAASISSGLSMIAAKIASGVCGRKNLHGHAKAVKNKSL